jgi:hypothetical protein
MPDIDVKFPETQGHKLTEKLQAANEKLVDVKELAMGYRQTIKNNFPAEKWDRNLKGIHPQKVRFHGCAHESVDGLTGCHKQRKTQTSDNQDITQFRVGFLTHPKLCNALSVS